MNVLIRPTLVTFAVLIELPSVVYPLVVTGFGQGRLAQVRQLIDNHTEGHLFVYIGQTLVNVLRLNLALDAARRWTSGRVAQSAPDIPKT